MNFLTILFFVFAATASATPITVENYSYGTYNNEPCSYGTVTSCNYSGTWAYGTTTTDSGAGNGSYYDGWFARDVFWVNSWKTVSYQDSYGEYSGVDMWGADWGSGSQLSTSTVTTQMNNTYSYADTTGYSSIGGSTSVDTYKTKSFSSYYYTCDDLGLCTQTSIWNNNAQRSYESFGWWTAYMFGQYQNSDTWQYAFKESFPDAQMHTTQWSKYGYAQVPSVFPSEKPSDTPEPASLGLIGLGLLSVGVFRRRS